MIGVVVLCFFNMTLWCMPRSFLCLICRTLDVLSYIFYSGVVLFDTLRSCYLLILWLSTHVPPSFSFPPLIIVHSFGWWCFYTCSSPWRWLVRGTPWTIPWHHFSLLFVICFLNFTIFMDLLDNAPKAERFPLEWGVAWYIHERGYSLWRTFFGA